MDLSDDDDDDDILEIVDVQNGDNVSNLPHLRFHCLVEKFEKMNYVKTCPQCYCYVCDRKVVECTNWKRHCAATDKGADKAKWKMLKDATKESVRCLNGQPQKKIKTLDNYFKKLPNSLNADLFQQQLLPSSSTKENQINQSLIKTSSQLNHSSNFSNQTSSSSHNSQSPVSLVIVDGLKEELKEILRIQTEILDALTNMENNYDESHHRYYLPIFIGLLKKVSVLNSIQKGTLKTLSNIEWEDVDTENSLRLL